MSCNQIFNYHKILIFHLIPDTCITYFFHSFNQSLNILNCDIFIRISLTPTEKIIRSVAEPNLKSKWTKAYKDNKTEHKRLLEILVYTS
jgi:hypothetical protein